MVLRRTASLAGPYRLLEFFNGCHGIEVRDGIVSNLFVFNVTANNNDFWGIQLFEDGVSTAKFVDVEAGIGVSEDSTLKLVLQKGTFCGNAPPPPPPPRA